MDQEIQDIFDVIEQQVISQIRINNQLTERIDKLELQLRILNGKNNKNYWLDKWHEKRFLNRMWEMHPTGDWSWKNIVDCIRSK